MNSRKPLRVALVFFVVLVVLTNMMLLSTMYVNVPFITGLWDLATITTVEQVETPRKDPAAAAGNHLKIAVVSTFVASTMWSKSSKNYLHRYTDHILNRECYCHLWKYDCIFNQTIELGLLSANNAKPPNNNNNNRTDTTAITVSTATAPSNTNTTLDPWWLKFGAWEKVAHLQAALPNYDWVLFGDIDYLIKDMSRPIESFIREFELYGKNNVQVLVPVDDNIHNKFAFSNFALLIKNSPFGRKILEHWRTYGRGLCPNGNFPDRSQKEKYSWEHSDQPGLWYALMKTHMDFHPNDVKPGGIITCNETTGLIASAKTYMMGIHLYFMRNGYKHGNYGTDLVKVPDHQEIMWSKTHQGDSMSGLGVDGNWFPNAEKFWPTAFALHYKKPSEQWDPEMQIELGMCKQVHGCSVSWNKTTGIRMGCGRNSSSLFANDTTHHRKKREKDRKKKKKNRQTKFSSKLNQSSSIDIIS